MKLVKIYVLKDPKTDEVQYVGRSTQPETRYRQHIYAARKPGKKDIKTSWIRSLLDKNQKPVLEIIDQCEPGEAKNQETRWIEEYNKRGQLKNQRDFVENGYLFSEESRKKMSESAKGNTNTRGKKRSSESCKRIGDCKKGNTYRRGKSFSEESKEKLRIAWENRRLKFANKGLGDSWKVHNKGKTLIKSSEKRKYV